MLSFSHRDNNLRDMLAAKNQELDELKKELSSRVIVFDDINTSQKELIERQNAQIKELKAALGNMKESKEKLEKHNDALYNELRKLGEQKNSASLSDQFDRTLKEVQHKVFLLENEVKNLKEKTTTID